MAITFDTFVEAVNTTQNLALPPLTTAATNEMLVIGVECNGGPVVSITGGLSWTNRGTFTTGGTQTIEIWTAPAAAIQSAVVFTVNATSNDFMNAVLMAFAGCNTSTPMDTNVSLPATSTNLVALQISTDNANDVMVAFGLDPGVAVDGTWVTVYDANFFVAVYKIVSATQTNVTPWTGHEFSIAHALVQGTSVASNIIGIAAAEW